MFLAIRDLRFAKGRFALMAAVIALITFLLVMLSGLTAGLGNQSTSAIAGLRADQMVFGAPAGTPAKASFTESEVSREQLAAWSGRDGVSGVEALGISQVRAKAVGSAAGAPGGTANVAVFGSGNGLPADPPGGLLPARAADGTVVVGETLAEDLHLSTRQPPGGGRHRTHRCSRSSRTSGIHTPASSGRHWTTGGTLARTGDTGPSALCWP